MSIWDGLKRKRDQRLELARLKFEREDVINAHRAKVKQNGWQTGDKAYQQARGQFLNEYQLVSAAIAHIETDQALAAAAKWQVPIPQRPINDEGNIEWEWHRVVGRHYLSDAGKALIRREVSSEHEMYYKPLFSWGAIVISVVSLVVSFWGVILAAK